MHFKLHYFIVFIFLFCLGGCGGSGGSASGTGGVTADFGINDETGPYCNNGAKIRRVDSGKQKLMSCEWDGASYGDKTDVHVTVTFKKTGSGPWVQDGDPAVTGGHTETDK